WEQDLQRQAAAHEERRRQSQRLRGEAEAERTRLATEQAGWRAQRDRLLAEGQAREAAAGRRQQPLEGLAQHWDERERAGGRRFQQEINRLRELHHDYEGLRDESQRGKDELGREQRNLAEAALALEQLQLEVIGRSGNAVAAEKALKRLRQRWAALYAESERR